MSDLFKDHRPELSDDEDRRLWQRVRAIPGEVAGSSTPAARAPWWRVLWAMPVVRYGAPAFAAVIIAVVWVVGRSPEPPARVAALHSERREALSAQRPVSELETAPAPAPTVATGKAAPPAPAPRLAGDEARKAPPREDVSNAPTPVRELAPAREESARPQAERELAPPAAPPSTGVTAKAQAREFAAPPKDALAGGAVAPATPVPAAPPAAPMSALRASSRDAGPAYEGAPQAFDAADRLARGALPRADELARHELLAAVVDAARLGPLDAEAEMPREWGWAYPRGGGPLVRLSVPAAGVPSVRFLPTALSGPGQAQLRYADAPARAQAALLAAVFERALASPADVPRADLESLHAAAFRIDLREAGQSRARLLSMLEGALRAWPAR